MTPVFCHISAALGRLATKPILRTQKAAALWLPGIFPGLCQVQALCAGTGIHPGANQLPTPWPCLLHSSALFFCALNPSFFITFFVCNTNNQVAITLFSKRIGISLLGHSIRGQFKLHRKQTERGIFSAPGDAHVTADTLAGTQDQTRTLQMPAQCSCDVLLFPTD